MTNVGSLKHSIDAFNCRSGIEAMFKDCKTGGYNLEKSHANNQRLNSLILLIASELIYSPNEVQRWEYKLWETPYFISEAEPDLNYH